VCEREREGGAEDMRTLEAKVSTQSLCVCERERERERERPHCDEGGPSYTSQLSARYSFYHSIYHSIYYPNNDGTDVNLGLFVGPPLPSHNDTHTHARKYARTHAHAGTHTHTQGSFIVHDSCTYMHT